ncbi:MAG TPA: hypothetical protein VEA69_08940 [Tepidisphaeraceae bacterium]|nr:hypothetical protein [Tepidisphaeraceae bacterium]
MLRSSLVALAVLNCVALRGASAEPRVASDPRLDAPYDLSADHAWNRLHRALFVRVAPDGSRRTHLTDPFLYRGGTYLLRGDAHKEAVAALDAFLATPVAGMAPVKRVMMQRDLWAAFDYAAWVADDWVHKSADEPAARALRGRLAKAIALAALSEKEIAALPENFGLAAKAGEFASFHDPKFPERPFLPADLYDPAGPWVRFHVTDADPMARQHVAGAGARSAFVVFLRLPGGRAATERYLFETREIVPQFPEGTMVAMVRRALAVDRAGKVRPTPITELVQVRVYRRIPGSPDANRTEGDFGAQDVCEFVMDRQKLFAGGHGLRPTAPGEIGEPFARSQGDPFEVKGPGPHEDPFTSHGLHGPTLKSCIQCHQAPGVRSMLTMRETLEKWPMPPGQLFRNYELNVELNYTVRAKLKRYEWGLLQGLMEGRGGQP